MQMILVVLTVIIISASKTYSPECLEDLGKREIMQIKHERVHDLSFSEYDLLARVVFAEAGNQGLTGMRYVTDVILNRVDSEVWSDTIYEVIYQPGQFSVVWNGAIERWSDEITSEAYKAVFLELSGERLDDEILYFNVIYQNGRNPWRYGDHWFSY